MIRAAVFIHFTNSFIFADDSQQRCDTFWCHYMYDDFRSNQIKVKQCKAQQSKSPYAEKS